MHFNENSDRMQVTNREGKLVYMFKFPKSKKGGYSVRNKKEKPTYSKY